MKIGYARVSTQDQNEQLQIDALKAAGCKKIYVEKASGTKTDRPELAKCLEDLRDNEDDALVVWRLDRLGRNLVHLIETVNKLSDRKIGFISLHEQHDTTSANGKLVFNIFASLAQFERDLISERTQAGLAAARSRGKTGGRPKKLTDKQVAMMRKMYELKELPVGDIAKQFNISRAVLYTYLKEGK